MNDNGEPQLRSWERRMLLGLAGLLTAVFGTWAGVVYNGTQQVVSEVRAVRAEMSAQRLTDAEYRTLLERRITILEQRQAFVLATLRKHEGEIIREED